MLTLRGPGIRSTRQALFLTQAGLGVLVGVHAVTVSKWERGKLQPSPWMGALLSALHFTSLTMSRDVRTQVPALIASHGPIAALGFLLPLPKQREESTTPETES